MKTLLILNDPPYGSERSYNGLRLARALAKLDPTFGPAMRKGGFLTRDPRVKERKKPGLKRARKAPQFSKR